MNTWLSAIMLVSAAAGFAVCAGARVPGGRCAGREAAPVGSRSGRGPVGDGAGRFRAGGSRATGRGTGGGNGHADGGAPVSAVVGMAVMLLAMADLTIEAVHLLPGVVWGLLMLPAGPLLLAGSRRASRSSHCGFGMHRSLSMIVMAALTIAGGHGRGAEAVSEHAHGGGDVLPVLLVIGVAALLAYTAVLVVTHHRVLHPGVPLRGLRLPALPRPVVESCLAATSVAAMAGAMIS